jgi:hypothetical protein
MTRRPRARGVIVAAAMITLLLTSCMSTFAPGAPTTQVRPLSDVDGVELRTSGDLTIVAGDTESLTVTAGSAVIDGLTSEVVDGTLILDSNADTGWGRIDYTLTVPQLSLVRSVGSGDISGSGILAPTATIDLSGSGSLSVTSGATTQLTVTVSGSGDVTIVGAATELRLSNEGSADFDGSLLEATTVDVTLSGSGDARVVARQELTASISGSGSLVYSGNPSKVVTSLTGSGEITAAPEQSQ